MALTNPDSIIRLSVLEEFRQRFLADIASQIEIDEDTGDIYIEYDDGIDEQQDENA